MFDVEEDWSDDPAAEALSHMVIHGTQLPQTNKVLGNSRKRSLLRTLQTLGSVPTWSESPAPAGSDESDVEPGPSPAKRKKKKRSRKKKTKASAEESGMDAEVKAGQLETTLKTKERAKNEKKVKEKFRRKQKNVITDSQMEENSKEVTEQEVRLNRQQWKNKMKNKRRCKNKYRPAVANGEKAETSTGAEERESAPAGPVNKGVALFVSNDGHSRKQKVHTGKRRLMKQKVQEEVASVGPQKNNSKELENGRKKGNVQDANVPQGEVPHSCPQKKAKERRRDNAKVEKLRRMFRNKSSESTEAELKDMPPAAEDKKEEAGEDPVDRSAALKARMEQRLEAARFRYLNEQLYTSASSEAIRMFRQDPQAFDVYHRGFTAQQQRWPSNPVDAIIAYIKQKPASLVIADFGCGDCKIARSVRNKVHSFDLAPICDLVTVCDMAKVPLPSASVNIAVFCLSLMGTNLVDFLMEANRVLVMGGVLKIAEVASRFGNVRSFLSALAGLGFKLVSKDVENSHFFSFVFEKTENALDVNKKVKLELRPCVYKKR